MAFEEQSLDPQIDFTHVGKNGVTMVIGKGQMVYWKGCNVTVITKDHEGKEEYRRLIGMANGQGTLEVGTNLYITDGQVKEA
jgi:hypothetical protein